LAIGIEGTMIGIWRGTAKGLFALSVVWLFAGPTSAADIPKPGAKANRLLGAASPYLRQHAYNPVDWHTWGEEAFAKARRQNKPIFLSVGYATCYWCHVMARESFADREVAKLLNAHTIPVKVDRERRPDVDATYMLATELISQQGGWPNSVFLTPDLKPFYGFGYVPKAQFLALIQQVATGWKDQRDVIAADADRVAGVIAQASNRRAARVEITPAVLRRASMHILARLDVFNGGLGTAPKFPQENIIQFLLHRAERDNDKLSGDAALLTLDNIIRGAIHDHVGGGFHRYATDNAWAIPHFEKMLYNQALIGRALLKAHQLTGFGRYGRALRKTLDFVLSDMTTNEGAFLSAFDAETDGVEGIYYLWTEAEIDAALGVDAAFAKAVFSVSADGNHDGRNTLRMEQSSEDLAASLKISMGEFETRRKRVLGKLKEIRGKRKRLRRDEKVLTGWNALMIRVLADAGVILNEPRYRKAAIRAQSVLMNKLGGATGQLKRSLFDGNSSLDAVQSDYALVSLSSVALFDATGERRWLQHAERLARVMVARFGDAKNGGHFLTQSKTGFTRTKETDDTSLPSGNAVAAELFARLVHRVPDVYWKQQLAAQLAGVSGLAAREPVSHAATLLAADIAMRGEAGAHQSASHGAVRVSVTRQGTKSVARVRLKFAEGWHINSITPKQDFLTPTRLRIEGVEPHNVTYPKPVLRKLGFHDETLSLYEGGADILVKLPTGPAGEAAFRLKLDVQACSDRICLEPQIVRALIPAAVK